MTTGLDLSHEFASGGEAAFRVDYTMYSRIFQDVTARGRLLGLAIGAMLLSTALVIAFGQERTDLAALSAIAAWAGFATNGAVVGLYALMAQSFPTGVRATATGFVIGIGRSGSALASALAGLLFAAGYGLSTVAALMALGWAVAAVALFVLGRQ